MSGVTPPSRSLIRTLLLACVVGAALLVPAQRASAQMGMGALMRPMVDSTEIDALVEMMQLNKDTEAAVRDLFVAFQGQHQAAQEKLQEIFQKAQQEAQGDPSAIQAMQKKVFEYYEHQLKIRDTLFDDIKLLLTPEQSQEWPAFERLNRRDHLLDSGQNLIPGSSVDLVKVLDDTRGKDAGPESPELKDMVTRYEMDLDRLLVEQRDLQADQLKEVQKLLAEGGNFLNQMDTYQKMFDESRKVQLKVREVNEKYSRQIAGLLTEANHAEFESTYNQRANPRVYSKNYMDKAFETATGLESLTPEQVQQIAAIQAEYQREVGPIRDKWNEQMVEWQSTMKLSDMFGGQNGNAELKAQEDAKKDLDDKYYTRLRGVLTEDQAKALPDRGGNDWRTESAFDQN